MHCMTATSNYQHSDSTLHLAATAQIPAVTEELKLMKALTILEV